MLQFNVHGKQRATLGPGRTLIKNFLFQINWSARLVCVAELECQISFMNSIMQMFNLNVYSSGDNHVLLWPEHSGRVEWPFGIEGFRNRLQKMRLYKTLEFNV